MENRKLPAGVASAPPAALRWGTYYARNLEAFLSAVDAFKCELCGVVHAESELQAATARCRGCGRPWWPDRCVECGCVAEPGREHCWGCGKLDERRAAEGLP